MGKKTGIRGGTFNPVHYGHLLLAEAAREYFRLDTVIFMPSGNPYMKKDISVLDGNIRAHMLRLAIKDNHRFSLSRMEIDRSGPTYTWETLAGLKKENPEDEFYFLMGADSLLMLENWNNPEYILQNCIIVAAVRGTGTEDRIKNIAQHLSGKYQADIRLLPSRYIDISSSEIRSRAKDGKSVRYMLPAQVAKYIEEKKLYRQVTTGEKHGN